MGNKTGSSSIQLKKMLRNRMIKKRELGLTKHHEGIKRDVGTGPKGFVTSRGLSLSSGLRDSPGRCQAHSQSQVGDACLLFPRQRVLPGI